jgi:hypothetical protein
MRKYIYRREAYEEWLQIEGMPIESQFIKDGERFYLAADVDAREAQGTAVIQAQRAKLEKLEKALREAIEDIESWAAYASEYFQEKHDLAGCLAKHRKTLGLMDR